MKSYLKQLVEQRVFLLTGKGLVKVLPDKMESNVDAEFEACIFPILIVSREMCAEYIKSYPIIDEKDLRGILSSEYGEDVLRVNIQKNESETELQIYKPNQNALAIIKQKACVWLPETYLLTAGECVGFSTYLRQDKPLYIYSKDKKAFSTEATGQYANADYFMLSVGGGISVDKHNYTETEYVQALINNLTKVEKKDLAALLVAQYFNHYIKEITHWPSFIGGASIGAALFGAVSLGAVTLQISLLESEIENQQVAKVIKLEKKLSEQIALLENLRKSQSGDNSTTPIWLLLGQLMESGVTVDKIWVDAQSSRIRLEADSAVETLELIRSYKYIELAEFDGPVLRSRGNQRFTVNIGFHAESKT